MRVLLWDPRETGHHPVWVRALVTHCPNDVELILPDWVEPVESPARSVSKIPQSSTNEALDLIQQIRSAGADGVIMAYAYRLIDSLSILRGIPKIPFVGIDLSPPQVMLHPSRFQPRGRSVARSILSLFGREVLIRRIPLQIAVFDPVALKIGTRRLRATTKLIPHPVEILDDYPVCRWPAYEHRIVLPGYIEGRKGFALLSESLILLAQANKLDPKNTEVVVAGLVDPPYRQELEDTGRKLESAGFPVRVIDRILGFGELSALLRSATVVALPYQYHRGASGILASMAGVAGPAIIAPAWGLIGGHALEMGAFTFKLNSSTSLSEALLGSLANRNRRALALPRGLGTEADFANEVWTMLLHDHTPRTSR